MHMCVEGYMGKYVWCMFIFVFVCSCVCHISICLFVCVCVCVCAVIVHICVFVCSYVCGGIYVPEYACRSQMTTLIVSPRFPP
jgi:hypothetical protein